MFCYTAVTMKTWMIQQNKWMNARVVVIFLLALGFGMDFSLSEEVKPRLLDGMAPVRGHDTGSLSAPLCDPPSRLVAIRKVCGYGGDDGALSHGLRVVVYLEPSEENPVELPGRCAYCFTVRSQTEPLDVSVYKFLTFYVRGEEGGERMEVALIDSQHEETMLQVSGLFVGDYVERKTIDSEWQKAKVPLEAFAANLKDISHILFIYDNRMYGTNSSKRIVMYLDELALE